MNTLMTRMIMVRNDDKPADVKLCFDPFVFQAGEFHEEPGIVFGNYGPSTAGRNLGTRFTKTLAPNQNDLGG